MVQEEQVVLLVLLVTQAQSATLVMRETTEQVVLAVPLV
jgi:hypothetical protein